ncbi:MAG: alpha/beta fold hydrolase [Caulobacterales bacterium]
MAHSETDRLSVDAGGAGPLAHLQGRVPPAPAWFDWAIAQAPERFSVSVQEAQIACLAWGKRGNPGLILLHGNGAHAEWWSFIAPFLADQFRIVAPSWSGMGDSDWRPRYHVETFGAEALAAGEAGGAFEGERKPLVLGHSFGGFPALWLARAAGERLAGVVALDTPLDPPGEEHGGPPARSKANRVYATVEEALARFRLAPPQPCDLLAAIDFIGRRSIKEAPGGFTWKFDPHIWQRFEFDGDGPLTHGARCPVGFVWGAQSALVTPRVAAYMRTLLPPRGPAIEIPYAQHHVMLDQPLALVSALRGLFAVWP